MLGHIMAEIITHAMIHYEGEPRNKIRAIQKELNGEIERFVNTLDLLSQRSKQPTTPADLRRCARQYLNSYNNWREKGSKES